jgi:hypothetical protein
LRTCLDTVDEWEADYRVENGFAGEPGTLIERWVAVWDRIPDSCAKNRLAIEYHSQAKEGIVISPTCTIEPVTHLSAARVETSLAVVCKKTNGN